MATKEGEGRVWPVAAFFLVALMVLITGWPNFSLPQLESDDYRYLALVEKLEQDPESSFWRTSVVENRWDHLWWMQPQGAVRFFRPAVILSFWLDRKLYPDYDDLVPGLILTNLILHLLCCWLAALLIFRLVGRNPAALLGSLLFAALYCHGEAFWYVSGRNATLVAFAFLLALNLHVCFGLSSRLAWLRYLGLPAFALGLAAKELAVGLPLLCLAHDFYLRRYSPGEIWRGNGYLYGGYLLVALGYFLLRHWALSSGDQDFQLVFPYVVSPLSSGFLPHLGTQVLSYLENLTYAKSTDPFLQPERAFANSSVIGLCFMVALLCWLVYLLRRERRFHFLCLLALLTWLPASIVYISERYLYLPSVAFSGAVALALLRLQRQYRWAPFLLLPTLFWIGYHGYWLHSKNDYLGREPRVALALERQLRRVLPELPPSKEVIFQNFPGWWDHAQFLQYQMRVIYAEPELRVHILSTLSRERASVLLEDANTLVVETRRQVLMQPESAVFPWVDLSTGQRIERAGLGFAVEVTKGDKDGLYALRCRFQRPVREYAVLQYERPRTDSRNLREMIAKGRLRRRRF